MTGDGPLDRLLGALGSELLARDDGGDDEGFDAVGVRTRVDDGRRGIYVGRAGSDGSVRPVPIADAVEAAIWRESDLARSALPDVEAALDDEALATLADGDRDAVTTRVEGHVVTVAADGTITVGHRPSSDGRLDAAMDRLHSLVPGGRSGDAADASGSDDESDSDDRSGDSCETEPGDDGDADRPTPRLVARSDDDGSRSVAVERLGRDGEPRAVPITDAVAAALWRETDLARDEIPDVAGSLDDATLAALATGEREPVRTRLAGHDVTVAVDGTIDVTPRPLTRCRTIVERSASVAGARTATDDADGDADDDPADSDPETVDGFRVAEREDGGERVSIERLGQDGEPRPVPVADAIEAALWRETDLERGEIPDVDGAVEDDHFAALARGTIDAATVRLRGHRVTVEADGTIEVRRQLATRRRSVLKVASVAGVTAAWSLGAGGYLDGEGGSDDASTDEGSTDDGAGGDGESADTPTPTFGYSGTPVRTTDGTTATDALTTVARTATATATSTATGTATATETDASASSGDGSLSGGSTGGSSGGSTDGDGSTATDTATETATSTPTATETPTPTETATEPVQDERDVDDYGQGYSEYGYGGVA